MTAAAQDRPNTMVASSLAVIQCGIYAAETLYEGCMACAETSGGYLVAAGTGTTGPVLGVCAAQKANTAAAASSGDVSADLLQGLFWMNNHGSHAVTQAHFGLPCYASDDNTVSYLSTDGPLAGIVCGIDSTLGVLVFISAANNRSVSQAAVDVTVTDAAGRFAGAEVETVLADLGARVALAFASTTTQTAYSATARADRQIAIVDDDDAGAQADGSLWYFDAASSAGASDYVRVPDAGTGRWLRLLPTIAELAAVSTGHGLSMLGLEDADDHLAATDGEAAVAEICEWLCKVVVAAADATGGATASALTADLKTLNGAALAKTGVVKLIAQPTQYAGELGTLSATTSWGSATKGSILASAAGWCIAKCDASGQFACTLSNSADETLYVTACTADGGVDALANGIQVVGCVPDSVAWSA